MLVKTAFESVCNRLLSAFNCVNSSGMSSSSSSSNKGALIFMHGLGDQGSSWHMQLASMIPNHMKCICPTAPSQPVTLNFGMKCNSWFDLRSLNPNDPEDETGIETASKRIHELIAEQERQGIPSDRILIGGFSQGGALALYSAFTYPKKLAGVIALSCWLPLHAKFPASCSDANKNISVLQCHGDQDFVVPIQWGQMSASIMSKFLDKSSFSFKIYDGLSHSSSTQELCDVMDFIKKHVPSK